jgi:ubiquinone/menaquinone biosynthesis C-methylase UbiE
MPDNVTGPPPAESTAPSLYDERPDLYDLQHDEAGEDLSLLTTLAEQSGGPILELGCGTGRVLEALAAALRRRRSPPALTGLDRSPAMLRAARERLSQVARPTVTLVHGDLRTFVLAERYALMVCALNTFMELLTPEDQLACLGRCAAYLATGGLLVLDLLNPYEALGDAYRGQLLHQIERTRPDGTTISLASCSLVDATAQYIETYRQYDEWGPARPLTRSSYTLTTRFSYRYEVEHLLARAGLVLDEAMGDYDGGPWTEEAPRLIVLARRVATP